MKMYLDTDTRYSRVSIDTFTRYFTQIYICRRMRLVYYLVYIHNSYLYTLILMRIIYTYN